MTVLLATRSESRRIVARRRVILFCFPFSIKSGKVTQCFIASVSWHSHTVVGSLENEKFFFFFISTVQRPWLLNSLTKKNPKLFNSSRWFLFFRFSTDYACNSKKFDGKIYYVPVLLLSWYFPLRRQFKFINNFGAPDGIITRECSSQAELLLLLLSSACVSRFHEGTNWIFVSSCAF